MKTNATTLFVSVAAAGIALGAPAPKERADTAFNALFDEGGFAYMQCAFAQHGETRYAFTRKADDAALATNKNTRLKNLNAPFDADTPLHVASVTKVVTAVLLVQLAEEGKLSLRDPVKRHVPLFPDDKVLILHLMTHTSGWRNKTGHSREPKQAEKFYTTLFKEAEIEERFQYMSQGYDILAEIVERVSGADDVLRNWEQIKKREKKAADGAPRSALAGVPAALPSLLRAQRVQAKAARVGFDWPDKDGPQAKIAEELGELDEAVRSGDAAKVEDEMGDVLFSVVNLCRFLKVDAETTLRKAVDKFSRRFQAVERMTQEAGVDMKDCSLEELDRYWEKAKCGVEG